MGPIASRDSDLHMQPEEMAGREGREREGREKDIVLKSDRDCHRDHLFQKPQNAANRVPKTRSRDGWQIGAPAQSGLVNANEKSYLET